MRKCMALIEGLPPGATLYRRTGGPLAWSDETTAALMAGHNVITALVGLLGDDNAQPPPAPEPPPIGWRKTQAAEADDAAWEAERVRRFKARQQRQAQAE